MNGNGFDAPMLPVPPSISGQGHSVVLTPPPGLGLGVNPPPEGNPGPHPSSLSGSTQGSLGGQQAGYVPWGPINHDPGFMPSPGTEAAPAASTDFTTSAAAQHRVQGQEGTKHAQPSITSAGLLAAAAQAAAASVSVSSNPAASRPLAAFLKCLYDLINEPSNGTWVHWSADGASFIIADVEGFAANVLPKYYRHSNFSSFSRQLNFYSFKKVMEDGEGGGGAGAGAGETGSNAPSHGQHGSVGSSVTGAGFTGILGLTPTIEPSIRATGGGHGAGVAGTGTGSKIGNYRTPNVLEYRYVLVLHCPLRLFLLLNLWPLSVHVQAPVLPTWQA